MLVQGFRNTLATLFWYLYLLLLFVSTFITNQYGSASWQWFTSIFFVFCAFYFIVVASLNLTCNFCFFKRARVFLVIFTMILVWLFLQTIIACDLGLGFRSKQLLHPDWFSPNAVISVVPHKTRLLIASEFLVFTVFIMTMILVDSRSRLRQLLLLVLFVGILHSIMALAAKFSGVFYVDPSALDGHYNVVRGWFVNRNHFAAFMVILSVAPLTFIFKKLYSKTKYKMANPPPPASFYKQFVQITFSFEGLVILCWSLLFIATILSDSRAGLISVLGSAFFISCFFYMAEVFDKKKFLLLILVFVVIVLLIGTLISDRILVNGLAVGERMVQWRLTMALILESPVIGFGGGSYATVFQTLRDYDDLRQVIYSQAHNHFLHIWVEQGFIGLILWLTLLANIFLQVVNTYRASNSTFAVSSSIVIGIVLMFGVLQSCVDFNLQNTLIRMYFFMLVAILMVVPSITSVSKNKY